MARSTYILKSSYYDSVVLMRVASLLKKEDRVSEVAMFMGTEGNHELLAQVGLTTEISQQAGPQDLIIIVDAESKSLADSITEQAISMLTTRVENSGEEQDYRPRTLDTALRLLPGATLAAISIPGEFAAREANRCLNKGLSVFLFSDNVSTDNELSLKKKAVAKNLLFMGPDCGTAYINGTGLGFANILNTGRIGCIAASGTGLQAVGCSLDQQGEGISHGIGVGGRDLSYEIGGIMTQFSLELLDQDEQTKVIILLSKPPHDDVVKSLEATCKKISTPVVTYFQGTKYPGSVFTQASTLDEAARMATCIVNEKKFVPSWFSDPVVVSDLLRKAGNINSKKRIVGLFTGGTLAKEAQLIFEEELGLIGKNLDAESGHIVVDLGDDQYTVGRPHPMIAPEIRTEKIHTLAKSGNMASCGILLVDLVLGNGSHFDPARELISSIEKLRNSHDLHPEIVAVVIGTDQDPQNKAEQIRAMEESGITVFSSNSEAARYALMLIAPACRENYLKEAL